MLHQVLGGDDEVHRIRRELDAIQQWSDGGDKAGEQDEGPHNAGSGRAVGQWAGSYRRMKHDGWWTKVARWSIAVRSRISS